GDQLGTARRTDVAPGVSSLVSADFNRDGIPDIVGAIGFRYECTFLGCEAKYDPRVAILYGNESGTLGPPTFFQAFRTLNSASALAVADVDGDGFPDVVALGTPLDGFPPLPIAVLLNDGLGGLLPPFTYHAGRGLGSPAVVAADLTED